MLVHELACALLTENGMNESDARSFVGAMGNAFANRTGNADVAYKTPSEICHMYGLWHGGTETRFTAKHHTSRGRVELTYTWRKTGMRLAKVQYSIT